MRSGGSSDTRSTSSGLRARARTARARSDSDTNCSSLYEVSMSAAFFHRLDESLRSAPSGDCGDLRARDLQQRRPALGIGHECLEGLRQAGRGAALRDDAVGHESRRACRPSCGWRPEGRGRPPCPRALLRWTAIRAAGRATTCRNPARCSSAGSRVLPGSVLRDEIDDAAQHAEERRTPSSPCSAPFCSSASTNSLKRSALPHTSSSSRSASSSSGESRFRHARMMSSHCESWSPARSRRMSA